MKELPAREYALFLKERREISYAKRGLAFALLAGFLWGVNSLLFEKGGSAPCCSVPEAWLLTPLLITLVADLTIAATSVIRNMALGKGREIIRAFRSRPGRYAMLSASLGTPIGQGCYLIALSLIDAAYAAPLVAAYPAVAAVAGKFFLKERVSKITMLGIILCITGVIAIGYKPASADPGSFFYLGIFFAFMSCLGYTAESTLSGAAIDFIEPLVVISVERITASLVDLFIIIPSALLFTHISYPELQIQEFISAFLFNTNTLYFLTTGIVLYLCYIFFYKGMNATGVARAVSMESTYAIWVIVLSAIFTDIVITMNLVIGAVVVFFGLVLIAGNPKDLIKLRNV